MSFISSKLSGCPKISCLVVDYRMPTMNGIELLKHLRRRQILAPAILVIEHSDMMVRERALTAGFVGVVDKTLLHDSLVNEIRRVLAIVLGLPMSLRPTT